MGVASTWTTNQKPVLSDNNCPSLVLGSTVLIVVATILLGRFAADLEFDELYGGIGDM